MDYPTRKNNRLTEYDYSMPNAYFITICTDKRKNLFWTHVGAAIRRPEDIKLTPWGVLAEQGIRSIPSHYPSVTVDCYTIMPNHVHLLLQIQSGCDGRRVAAPTISTVVNQLKGAVSRQAGISLWQKGFYDHVIRGDADYREIWEYIEGNPGKWVEDKLYTATI